MELGKLDDKFWLRYWGIGLFGIDIVWLDLWRTSNNYPPKDRWCIEICKGGKLLWRYR